MTVRRHHLRDEEPDVDERSAADQHDAEEIFGAGLCHRCGHADHPTPACPYVTALVLKDPLAPRRSRRSCTPHEDLT